MSLIDNFNSYMETIGCSGITYEFDLHTHDRQKAMARGSYRMMTCTNCKSGILAYKLDTTPVRFDPSTCPYCYIRLR